MYQKIGETIAVAGVYAKGKFLPKKFQWHQKTFFVDTIHSVHDFKDGSMKKRRFSVTAEHTVYLLEFNRDAETWTLAEIWVAE